MPKVNWTIKLAQSLPVLLRNITEMCLHCFLYMFFVNCLVHGIHCQHQHFRVRPNDTDVTEGQNVEFQCHVANKAGSVQWSKDGFLLVPGFPRYTMLIDERMGIYNLVIRDVKVSDEGEFQCQVGPSSNQNPIRVSAKLVILIPPQALSINDLPAGNNIEVRQGDKIVLYCKAVGSKPPTQLVWFKNDNELFDDDAQISFDEEKHRRYTTTSSITLYPAVDDNGAIYSCEARHPALERYLRCSVAINVLHAPGVPRIEGYIEGDVVFSGDTLTLACITRGGNPPPHLVWNRGNVQVDATYTVSGHVTTNIHTFRVDASDNNGVYRCEASSIMTKEPLSASVKLSVHYPAANVKLIGPLEARKGDTVTLTCSTDVSNPPSQISWVVDGSVVVGGEEQPRKVADGWITSSNLTITLTRQDPDVKTFACYAENPPVRKKTFRSHKITVTYPPQPPTIIGYEEGSSLRVGDLQRFNCVALGGNPPANLRWFKGDREISAPTLKAGSGVSSELVIRVEPSDNGAVYRCEANNTATEMPLVAFVELIVYFPPTNVTITVKPCDPRAGDEVTLACTSGSSNPLSRISWKRDGHYIRDHQEETLSSAYRGISTRSFLTFPVTSADDRSVFECKATSNDLPPVMSNTTIRVRHKPEFPDPFLKVDVVEGNNATVNVSVYAYPPVAWISWSKDGSLIAPASEEDGHVHRVMSAGSALYVTNVKRKDGGIYICMAENEEGTSNATITLNVQYPATIINITSMAVVAEGEDAYFECSVSANPLVPDMIRWSMRGGGGITRENQQITENGRSVLTLFNVSKQDSGILECEAHNGLGDPDVKSATLVALYKPVIIRSSLPTKLAAEPKSSVELRCVAEGDGNISFVWSFNSTVIIHGLDIGRYDIRSGQISDTQWCSILTVKRVRGEDFGEYTCVARSHLGYDFIKISLVTKGLPEVPRDLLVVNDTSDSVTLSWIPGFDGGMEQSYRIRFKKTSSMTYFYRETYSNASIYTVTGLSPGLEYFFSIASYNNFGESDFTEEVVSVITREVTSTISTVTMSDAEKARRSGSKMWLTSAIIGGVVFLVTCLCCVFCVWRKCSLMTSEVIIPIAQFQRQEESRGDICNRLLIRPEDKQPSTAGVQNVNQEQVALREFQMEQRTLSWEETSRSEYGRTRSLTYDRRSYDEIHLKEGKGSLDNVHSLVGTMSNECPDILRNDNSKCLSESKEASDLSSSPRSTSPESPRYSSTTSSDSSDTRSSVYHEKTSLHSLHSLRSTLSSLSRSRELRGLEYITVKNSHPIVLINIDHGGFQNTDS